MGMVPSGNNYQKQQLVPLLFMKWVSIKCMNLSLDIHHKKNKRVQYRIVIDCAEISQWYRPIGTNEKQVRRVGSGQVPTVLKWCLHFFPGTRRKSLICYECKQANPSDRVSHCSFLRRVSAQMRSYNEPGLRACRHVSFNLHSSRRIRAKPRQTRLTFSQDSEETMERVGGRWGRRGGCGGGELGQIFDWFWGTGSMGRPIYFEGLRGLVPKLFPVAEGV